MIKRYNAKDELVELTQEYFDMLQAKYLKMILLLQKEYPEIYAKVIENNGL